jgi:hypothetical protein
MSNKQDTNLIVLVILAAVIIYWYCSTSQKNREGYTDSVLTSTGSGSSLQFMNRPTFNTALDPNNPQNRSDWNASANVIRGQSPNGANLAAPNVVNSTSISNAPGAFGDQTQGAVVDGQYVAGMNDAGQYVGNVSYDHKLSVSPLDALSQASSVSRPGSDFERVKGEFAYLGMDANTINGQTNARKDWEQKYSETLSAQKPNTLDYTNPKDLLPVPDLRTPLMRDPSDPENFMYTRTLFAPLKTRNHNIGDRIRGDLNIQPIKTGWFDVATVPSIDLIKGYFGYYNDISEYTDVQDAIYQKDRDLTTNPQRALQTQSALQNITKLNSQAMTSPNLAYGSGTDTFDSLKFGSVANGMSIYDVNPFKSARALDQ